MQSLQGINLDLRRADIPRGGREHQRRCVIAVPEHPVGARHQNTDPVLQFLELKEFADARGCLWSNGE